MFSVFRILYVFVFVFISLIWGQFFSGMQILYNCKGDLPKAQISTTFQIL